MKKYRTIKTPPVSGHVTLREVQSAALNIKNVRAFDVHVRPDGLIEVKGQNLDTRRNISPQGKKLGVKIKAGQKSWHIKGADIVRMRDLWLFDVDEKKTLGKKSTRKAKSSKGVKTSRKPKSSQKQIRRSGI